MPHGIGRLIDLKRNTLYEGQFKKGTSHGFGRLFYSETSHYVGMFENDEKHGEGILYNRETGTV